MSKLIMFCSIDATESTRLGRFINHHKKLANCNLRTMHLGHLLLHCLQILPLKLEKNWLMITAFHLTDLQSLFVSCICMRFMFIYTEYKYL